MTSGIQPVLLYIGDPMCSWCYGIGEELSMAMDHLCDLVDFEIIVGGLRSAGDVVWDEKFTDFLRHHWEEVAQASGQEFSYGLLDLDHFEYNTEPSCRAVVVAQQMDRSKNLRFFKAVQRKFYFENQDPTQIEFYRSICEASDLDYATFVARYRSEDYSNRTQNQYDRAKDMGVRSFPTLVLKHRDQYTAIARGYTKGTEIISKVELALQK